MVIKDCFAFANDVSPQTAISFLSWTILKSLRQVSIVDLSSLKYARGDQSIERERIDRGIGVDHEQILVECWIHTDHVLDLVVNLEL